MKRDQWEQTLKDQIKFDADFIPSFQTTIKILAEILEERDNVYSEYQKTGARPVIDFTSDRGAVNPKPNPLLRQWQELNTSALAYLRDLGLTAAGLRKLQGQIPERKGSGKGFSKLDDYFDMMYETSEKEQKNDHELAEEMGLSFEEYAQLKVSEDKKNREEE